MVIIITILAVMLVVGTWLLVLRRKRSQRVASTDDNTIKIDLPVEGQAGSDLTQIQQALLPAVVPASDTLTQSASTPFRLPTEQALNRVEDVANTSLTSCETSVAKSTLVSIPVLSENDLVGTPIPEESDKRQSEPTPSLKAPEPPESIETVVAAPAVHVMPSVVTETSVPSDGSNASKSRPPRRLSPYVGVAPPAPAMQKNVLKDERNIPVAKDDLAEEVPANNLRLQVIPDRHGGVRLAGLIASRQGEMPSEVSVTSALGEFSLVQLDDTRFETLTIPNLESALCDGIELIAKDRKQSWRWILSKRSLFVLAQGEEFGTSGYLSVPRLLVGEEHMVLVREQLYAQTLRELEQAGCEFDNFSEVAQHPFPGWRLLRGVEPTRAVNQVSDNDILNALRPVAQVRLHFVGGIRIKKADWLEGDPPHIHFTGVLPPGFAVLIDGKLASLTEAGFYESENWDTIGTHQVWFADQARNYRIIPPPTDWAPWRAHDFGIGAAICGASVLSCTASLFGVTVPAGNPLLIGPSPGQVWLCSSRRDLRAESICAWVAFEPVWALPADPAHCNKSIACVQLIGQLQEPGTILRRPIKRRDLYALQRWCNAIQDARRKRLKPCGDDDAVIRLWQEYKEAARVLWRRLR